MFWKQNMLLLLFNTVSEGWDGHFHNELKAHLKFLWKRKNNFGYIFPRVIIKSKLFVYSLNARTILYLHLFSEYLSNLI